MSGKFKRYKRPNWSSFYGRADRREWLRITLQTTVISALLSAFSPTLAPLLSIPFVLILLATTTRRLHDLKLSGWIQTIPMAITVAALALRYIGQRSGLAGLTPVFGRDKLDLTHASTSTFGDFLKINGSLLNFEALTLNQALLLVLFAVAAAAYLAFYGVLLLVSGNRGPNCYGESA